MTFDRQSEPRIDAITQRVVHAAKEVLGERLDKVILFGSYARGDFDNESDVDLMILAHMCQKEVSGSQRDIRKKLPGIDLAYDIAVCIHVTGTETFSLYQDVLPFYKNIVNEGVLLYG